MNRYLFMFSLLVVSFSAVADDNEIYVDQSGASSAIDLEQLGSANIIGGSESVAGTVTALDLDGTTMTLDINQIGSNNIFRSDAIDGDNFTGFFEFDGDSNVWDLLLDASGLNTSDYVNLNIDVTGSSNIADIKLAADDSVSYLNLDWIITGDSNEFDFDIDYENATNYMDINGSSNDITFEGNGYSGNSAADAGYFYLELDGSTNVFNIKQQSTLARDYLKIITNTSNSNICITQNDGGSSTGC